MTEVIYTGEMTDAGYEYPLICPLGICQFDPTAMIHVGGQWQCEECGKVVIVWERSVE